MRTRRALRPRPAGGPRQGDRQPAAARGVRGVTVLDRHRRRQPGQDRTGRPAARPRAGASVCRPCSTPSSPTTRCRRGASSGGPDGDLRLVPDLDHVVALAGQPGWAWAPVDRYDPGRHAARRLLADCCCAAAGRRAAGAGPHVQGRHRDRVGARPRRRPYGVRAGLRRPRLRDDPAGGAADFCADALAALAAEGVEVDQIHPEYAAGQYEVSVRRARPRRRRGPLACSSGRPSAPSRSGTACGSPSRRPSSPAGSATAVTCTCPPGATGRTCTARARAGTA